MFKYRVHEVAKDFKVPTKTISQIMTDYAHAPKNHMQVLTPGELDLIFEYMTQHNQIGSIEEIYAVESHPPSGCRQSAEGKKEAPEKTDEKAGQKTPVPERAAQAGNAGAPAARPSNAPAARKPDKPFVPRQERQKRVIDTSGATINIAKYDERLDNLVPERAERIKSGKEKFSKKTQGRGPTMASGAKRRQEERQAAAPPV
jgi:translation initiation factor IF-2